MNFKKVLALILVVAMCLSMVPTYAFAEDVELWDEEEVAAADDTALEDVYLDEEPAEVIVEDEPEATEPEAVEVEEPAAEEPAAVEGLVAEETNALEAVVAINENKGTAHDSLQDAIDKASDGDVITMHSSITAGATVNKNVTINGSATNTVGGTINVAADVTLNLYSTATTSVIVNSGVLSISGGSYNIVTANGVTSGNITGGTFGTLDTVLLADGYVGADDIKETKVTVGKTTKGEIKSIGTGFVTQLETADSKVYYKNLATAIDDAQANDIVKLNANITDLATLTGNASTDTLIIGKSLTLDLNGHNINTSGRIRLGASEVNTTIAPALTITGTGTIETTNAGFAPVELRHIAKGSLIIDKDVTLKGSEYGLNLFGTNGSEKNDFNVTISGTVNGEVFILGNLTNTENGATVNVTETAKINAVGHVGICLCGFATVNVAAGAEISGKTGIEVRAGKLNVKGGTITGTGAPTTVTPNDSGTTTVGAGIAVAQHTTKLPITVTVENGTINGYTAFNEANPQRNGPEDVAKISLSITGGTFTATQNGTNAINSADVTGFISGGTFSSAVPDNCCAEGFVSVKNADGTYSVETGTYVARVADKGSANYPTAGEGYKTLADAVTAALSPVETGKPEHVLVLLRSLEATEKITLGANQKLNVYYGSANITKLTEDSFVKPETSGLTITAGTSASGWVHTFETATYAAMVTGASLEKPKYYPELNDAIVAAAKKDVTLTLLKAAPANYVCWMAHDGDFITVDQSGEFKLDVKPADKFVFETTGTDVITYRVKAAVASYAGTDGKPAYTTTFVEAATEAAKNPNKDGVYEVKLYKTPVLEKTDDAEADIYTIKAGTLKVVATGTDIKTDEVYKKIVKDEYSLMTPSYDKLTTTATYAFTAPAAVVTGAAKPAYYATLDAAIVAAAKKDVTLTLLKAAPANYVCWMAHDGDFITVDQSGEFKLDVKPSASAELALDIKDNDGIITYTAKPAVASYHVKADSTVTPVITEHDEFTLTFAEAATEAAKNPAADGSFAVTVYQVPTYTETTKDVYSMGAGKLVVTWKGTPAPSVEQAKKYVTPNGDYAITVEINSGSPTTITYTSNAAKARIDLANGKDPLYFASIYEAVRYVDNLGTNGKNLVIVPLADDSWAIPNGSWSSANHAHAFKIADSTFNVEITYGGSQTPAAFVVVKTPADGYTTYELVAALAKIANFPNGKTDDYGNPQYETRYYATLADAIEAAAGTKTITLLADISEAYTLGATDVNETLIISKYYDDGGTAKEYKLTVKPADGYALNTVTTGTGANKVYTYTLETPAAYVTDANGNVTNYLTFAAAANAARYNPNPTTGTFNPATIKVVTMLKNAEADYKLTDGFALQVKTDGFEVNVIPTNNTTDKTYAIDDTTVADGVTTFKSVRAVASIGSGTTIKYYATIDAAAEAAAGTQIITTINNGAATNVTYTYEFTAEKGVETLLVIKGSGTALKVTSAVENKGVVEANVPAATGVPAHTSYTLTSAAAYVTDGENVTYYDTFDKAAAANYGSTVTTGMSTIVLLDNVTSYSLPYGKQINVQKDGFTINVKPGHQMSGSSISKAYAVVETPNADGTVINFKSVEAVASITSGTGTDATTTYYASFKKAAETAFVSADTAEADALEVVVLQNPVATDIFEPTANGYLLVSTTFDITNNNISVTDPMRKSAAVTTAGTPHYRINITSAVASVTANNGEVKYFTTIEDAADFASQSERNPIVLLSDGLVLEFKHGHTPIYVDKNGHNDFVVTKEDPDSSANNRDAVVEEDLGNNVTKYSLAAGVAYFDLVETKDKDDYGTEEIHTYVFFETFAKAREAANNGEHVIYIVAHMSNTTAKNDTYVIEDVNELLRISNSGNYKLYVEPAEGFALNVVPEKNANDQPNGIVDYSVSTAVASVKALFDGDTAVTEPTYTDLKTAIDDAIATYGATFSNGRITLLAAPAEDFTYPLGAEDQLRVVNGTYNFTKDNFTAPEGYYVVEDKDSGAAYGLTFYSVKETVASIGEGEAIQYFDKLADAVTAVKALETGTGADQTNPKTVITLYKSIPDTPAADLVTMDGNLFSLLIKDQGFDPNLKPNGVENFVEKTATETEGVNKYTLKSIVASITVGKGDDAVTTNYSTFAAAAADAVNTEKVVILHKHPLATTDIYKMPLGTLNVWRDDDGWTQPVTDLAGTAVVADGDGAYVSYKLVYVPNTNTVDHVQFIASGKEASIFYQNTGVKVYDTIDEAIKDAMNNAYLVVTPLASLDKQLNTTLTGTIADGDFFHMEDTEYDVNLVVDGFEIVRDENDPTLYTFKTAVAYVYTEMVESYDAHNNPTYVKAFFSTIANASKYASQANAAAPKTIVLLQNDMAYELQSENEVVVAQFGDAPYGTAAVEKFTVSADVEGFTVSDKLTGEAVSGVHRGIHTYRLAKLETITLIAGEGAWGTGTTAEHQKSAQTYAGGDLLALPDYAGTVHQPEREGYTLVNWTGNDGNTYVWKFNGLTEEEIAAGYKVLPSVMPEGGLELKANWKANEYWVVLRAEHDASAPFVAFKGTYGEKLTLPEDLSAIKVPGYDFDSWYKYDDTSFTTPWNFSNDLFVNTDTVKLIDDTTATAGGTATAPTGSMFNMLAKKMPAVQTITWNFEGGTPNPDSKYPEKYLITDESVTIAAPSREGYTFAGWNLKIDGEDKGTVASTTPFTYTLAKGYSGNRVFTAIWTPIVMNIQWVNDTIVLKETTAKVGDRIDPLTRYGNTPDDTTNTKNVVDLTKDGYRLDPNNLWNDYDGVVPYDESHTWVYHLNWIEQIPVSFFVDDEVTTINVDKNSSLAESKDVPAPTKEGYTLVWTLKGEQYDMTAAVSEKMTLVGEWVEGEDYSDYATISPSLSLDENINMNAYVKIKEGTDPSDYSVIATFEDNTTMEGTLADLATYSRGEYKLSDIAVVAAPQMNEPVTVTISYKGNDVLTKDLTVRGYAEDWIERSTTDNDLRELLIALLDFGAYSQLQFNYDTTNLANSKYSSGIVPSTVVPTFEVRTEGSVSGITGSKIALTLVSDTTMNMFFAAPKKGSYQFKIDGEEASATYSKKEYKVILPKIAVAELGDTHAFTVTGGNATMTVTAAPLAYAYQHQNDSGDLGNVCKAVYLYYLAAVAYFG